MSIWSPAPRTFRTLPSRRHTPWPTRITPTRSSSPTTIPEPPPANYSGASFSTDGGTTFTRLNPSPFCSWPRDELWRPCYSLQQTYQHVSLEFFWLRAAADRASAPGSPLTAGSPGRLALAFTTAAQDDRESGWADNNPSSPFFGRMYVSWNDFAVGSGASSHASPLITAPLGPLRNSELYRLPSSAMSRSPATCRATATVYIAGMDEGGGGFPHNNINHIYRSTDGGNTWTNTYTGPAFPGPGVGAIRLLRLHVYRLAVATGGTRAGVSLPPSTTWFTWSMPSTAPAADPGDVYYIRSTDSGVTFSAPFKLNTDATTRPQWQPNLSVSPSGTLFATWYDARESASCTHGNPARSVLQDVVAQVQRQRRDLVA